MARDRRWQRHREELGTALPRSLGGSVAQPGDLSVQVVAVREHSGGGLDLARRQLKLKIDAALAGSVRDVGVVGYRLATVGVDEQELLLYPDSGHTVSA